MRRLNMAPIPAPKKPKKNWRTDRFKPGETCLKSGQYGNTQGDQITMVRGDTFPATPRPGMSWKISDVSRGAAG